MAAFLRRILGASLLTLSLLASAGAQEISVFSNQAETAPFMAVLKALTEDYAQEHPDSSWTYEMAAPGTIMQKLQIYAASDALPLIFTHPDQPALRELYRSGRVINTLEKLKELGLDQYLDPMMIGRVQLVEQQGDDVMYEIPVTKVIEGFFYNKALFEQAGVTKIPTTWKEFLAVCKQLDDAGIQPILASGNSGWSLLRLVGMYAQRKLGNDAMERVRAGELSLTDPGFVEAAQAIKDLAQAGYFGDAYVNMTFPDHLGQFVQGGAAMTFLPSSLLGQFENPEFSSIPPGGLGFFNFPTVPGGSGTLDAWMVTAGLTLSIGTTAYERQSEEVDEWLRYVIPRYGAKARELGFISALITDQPDAPMSPMLKEINDILGTVRAPLWPYEQYFSSKAFSVGQYDAALFMSSDMTAEEYANNVAQANEE